MIALLSKIKESPIIFILISKTKVINLGKKPSKGGIPPIFNIVI